jgi:hypothetical protein
MFAALLEREALENSPYGTTKNGIHSQLHLFSCALRDIFHFDIFHLLRHGSIFV